MHKSDQVSILFDTLAEGSTVTGACKRAGVSRMFYSRRYKNDSHFRQKAEEARARGRESNDDLLTTVFQKKIRDGHWQAIHYALGRRDAAEEKAGPAKPVLALSDVRYIIDSLPENARDLHYTHLRELIDDATEFTRTGKIGPRHPDGL